MSSSILWKFYRFQISKIKTETHHKGNKKLTSIKKFLPPIH